MYLKVQVVQKVPSGPRYPKDNYIIKFSKRYLKGPRYRPHNLCISITAIAKSKYVLDRGKKTRIFIHISFYPPPPPFQF